MDICSVWPFYWNFIGLAVLSLIEITQQNEGESECSSISHACSSLLRLDQYTTVHDGSYCQCKQKSLTCSESWLKYNNRSSFTWYHHERVDWILQFHFCAPVINVNKCTLDEEQSMIFSLQVKENKWNPHLASSVCHCKNNKYYMKHWEFHKGNSTGRTGFWLYHFTCDSKICKSGSACLKHYMDSSVTHTKGYTFLCSCPHGYQCPVSIPEQKINSYEMDGTDSFGSYMFGYCQEIPGWHKDSADGTAPDSQH